MEEHIVSYSELDTFRQCPLKHRWGYVQRWTKGVVPGSALDKGSLWHAVMERHYGVIKLYQDHNQGNIPDGKVSRVLARIWEKIEPLLFDPVTGEQTETQEIITWMYKGYVEYYGLDDEWRVVAIEHQIITPLRDKDGEPTPYKLKAKIDLIMRSKKNGKSYVWDHKSCSDLPTYMALEMDDQFGLYQWALAEMRRPVMGAMHSAARTKMNVGDKPGATTGRAQTFEQRFARTPMPRSPEELRKLALDAYNAAYMARPPQEALQFHKTYSAPDPRQCGWKCDFKEVHLALRKSRQEPARILRGAGFIQDFRRH